MKIIFHQSPKGTLGEMSKYGSDSKKRNRLQVDCNEICRRPQNICSKEKYGKIILKEQKTTCGIEDMTKIQNVCIELL